MPTKIREFLTSKQELLQWQTKINRALSTKASVYLGNLTPVVAKFYSAKKASLLALAKRYPTPFYAFDKIELTTSAADFKRAFAKYLPNCSYFYAVKTNWHPSILKTVVDCGFGLDVSSGRELSLGLKAKAKKMVFSGPGKTTADLLLALKHRHKVIVHLDSFGELERLGKLSSLKKQTIVAGVRIYTRFHGSWSKFGIKLNDLSYFWKEAKKYPYLKLSGIQFHISWNKDASTYENVIKELAGYLKKNFSTSDLSDIKFIDFGGGFLPYRLTGDYPWGTAQGDLIKKAADHFDGEPKFNRGYYLTESVTLPEYARGIAQAINRYLRPLINCRYFTEPGRIICNNSMHLVTRVVDIKDSNKIIMDSGVNAVGWEGLRYDYTPVINLSSFAKKEIPCYVFGSLCMADDVWSYSMYASKINSGDVTVIPNFGAYTFALSQEFIKGVPKVYPLKN
ncbi:MAG: hypothetical protein WCV73_03800 [Patescibacteria group bacterium]